VIYITRSRRWRCTLAVAGGCSIRQATAFVGRRSSFAGRIQRPWRSGPSTLPPPPHAPAPAQFVRHPTGLPSQFIRPDIDRGRSLAIPPIMLMTSAAKIAGAVPSGARETDGQPIVNLVATSTQTAR
jgi:hypothetical protein